MKLLPARTFVPDLWRSLWLTKGRVARVLVALATLLVSTWIGFQYADNIFVHMPVIAAWLVSILVCFIAFFPAKASALFELKFKREHLVLLLLVAFSFSVRLFALPERPSGFHPDEAGYVQFAILHIFDPDNQEGTINPLRTGPDSQPILYSYVLYLNTVLFGWTIPGARMSSVLIGALAVAATFLLVDEMAGRRPAWLAAVLMSVYHYHVHWSRLALSNIWTTFLPPLALALFLRGWRKGNPIGALLAGICLGLSAHVYSGGYVVVLLLPLLFWQLWMKTRDRVGLTLYTGKMLVLAAVIAAPLVVFAFLFPQHFFGRANSVNGWSPVSMQIAMGSDLTPWTYFVEQVKRSFGAYNFTPEITGFYNPQTPFLMGFASILFLVGIGLAIQKRQYFPLLWITLVTILGGVMILGTPSSTHFIAAIPAICWLVALPLDHLFEKNPKWAYLLLAVVLATDLVFYFWIYNPAVNADLDVLFPEIVR